MGWIIMRKPKVQHDALIESRENLEHLIAIGASDTQIMKARIQTIVHDKDLQKKVLIDSGVYDKNLKLTKHYR